MSIIPLDPDLDAPYWKDCPTCGDPVYYKNNGFREAGCRTCRDNAEDRAYNKAVKTLLKYDLSFTPKRGARMIIVQHPTKSWQAYDYRYTTGRWASLVNRKNKLKKHYYSKGIEDFIKRFVLS